MACAASSSLDSRYDHRDCSRVVDVRFLFTLGERRIVVGGKSIVGVYLHGIPSIQDVRTYSSLAKVEANDEEIRDCDEISISTCCSVG